ncbi:MAG: glutamate formimidoyltransferase [Acidimicrobiia bacterium]|nr:glutamate formimidoyltransferase [Acidimicrobiia bacterium]
MQLIECVPNFSEGRDQRTIDAISAAIAAVDGVHLLDVDPGADTNRTVMTFVGNAQAVEDAAFDAITTAGELIDMRSHSGEHPRMGATDVCPFVPVQGATMDDCVTIARRLGARVGEAGIPVYLYEAAATSVERTSLSDVRRGEYEGLSSRDDSPDFGPDLNERSGATAIGARKFLIAYNINLNTTDRKLADAVAGVVRGSGVARRDGDGAIVRGEDGKALRQPGRFASVKGVGWYISEYGRAQVSLNLTDQEDASLHQVFDACVDAASDIGIRVTGSELVGLVPRQALLAAGDHYLAKQGRTTGVPEAERLHSAVLSLGLAELAAFDPLDKVIEYRVGRASDPGLQAYVDELSTDSFAPGGGSVAALSGSLAAALTAMVAALTWSKTKEPQMEQLGREAQELKDWFLLAADRDAEAYNAVIAARRLPRKTKSDRQARDSALEAANQDATRVPLEVLERSVAALELCARAAKDGNPSSVTDAGVGALCARAAAEGAAYNVRINLPSIEDDSVRDDFAGGVVKLTDTARSLAAEVAALVEGALEA